MIRPPPRSTLFPYTTLFLSDLTRVVVLVRGGLDGPVEIGVGEDEERALAAKLERHRSDVLRRGARDVLGRLDRSRERDARDLGARDERGAHLLADPLNHVQDARREPGVRSEERRVGKECRSRWSPYH